MTARLPVEILTAIFEEVDNVRDLWHVRAASRILCAAATPIAFRVLSVITTRGSARNLGLLFDVPDIALHVREIAYHDTGADRRGKTLKYVRTSAVHELASSFSRIHQLPRLETINLTFCPAYHDRLDSDGGGRLALQTSILSALEASFSIRAPPKLTSLSLHNLRTSDLPPRIFTVLTNLQHLQLSVLFDRAPDPYTFPARWFHFWSTLFPHRILTPTQHALTKLTLHSDEHIGASCGLSLVGLHFPYLCALSLLKFVFEPSVGAEDFVLRHAATLLQLELLSCKLPVRAGTPSSTLAQDEGSSTEPGGWYRIWDCFAAELTSLVALHVDERSYTPWGSAGPECRYVNPGPGMSFWKIQVDPLGSCDAADIAALRRFHMTVAARSEEARS